MPGGIFLLDPAGELTEMAETATYFRENRAEMDLQHLLTAIPTCWRETRSIRAGRGAGS